eukprot:GGOE01045170.1.p2 GENE.GGOE01045170.1~~GGOE01045170.1.p2  ORF type:complete len:105 (-),score=9.21 GGOE01045170.1:15-329(-)
MPDTEGHVGLPHGTQSRLPLEPSVAKCTKQLQCQGIAWPKASSLTRSGPCGCPFSCQFSFLVSHRMSARQRVTRHQSQRRQQSLGATAEPIGAFVLCAPPSMAL